MAVKPKAGLSTALTHVHCVLSQPVAIYNCWHDTGILSHHSCEHHGLEQFARMEAVTCVVKDIESV